MWLNSALVLMTLLYPLAVFFGLQHWQPASMGLLLALVVALRLLLGSRVDGSGGSDAGTKARGDTDGQYCEDDRSKFASGEATRSRWLLSALLVFAVAVYLVNDQQLLRFYPVLMNGLMLLMFSYTLLAPPPMAERLARLREPDLDPRGVRYTRKVTWVWCGFFLLNGCVAAWTAVGASLAVWTLYNGLYAYLVMALVFAIEYLIRQRLRARHQV